MNTVGYVRTSTLDQEVNNQVIILKEQGLTDNQIFIDAGISGLTPARQRKAFGEMLNYIDEHGIKQIYITPE